MPGVNQAGLNRLSQDLAGPMRTNPRAQVDRISFQAGEAQAYRFTTSDYNMPFHKMFTTGENPQQNEDGGILYVSVSKCPGDFTSPELTNGRAVFSNGFVQVGGCFSEGLGQPRLDFGYRQTGCQLEPNQTYYLNISSGFKWQVLDVVIYQSDIGFFGYKTSTGGASQAPIMVMKGMEDTYREIHSVLSAWNTSAYNAMQDLRNRIAACVNSGQPRTSCNFTPNIPAFPGQWR
ncbi:MAG TPA: hypothetical protein PKD95_01250, partial [Candidatus Paceibacterota bacterium]|nr:hypothetical protein [Candidatus Paceibacterota bacterium]